MGIPAWLPYSIVFLYSNGKYVKTTANRWYLKRAYLMFIRSQTCCTKLKVHKEQAVNFWGSYDWQKSTHTLTKAQKWLQTEVKGYDRFTIPHFIQCSSSESHYDSCLWRQTLAKSLLGQAHKAEAFFRSKRVTFLNQHSQLQMYQCNVFIVRLMLHLNSKQLLKAAAGSRESYLREYQSIQKPFKSKAIKLN